VKIAFVTQPWARALPPSESLAIGTKEIAERLGDGYEPVIWSQRPSDVEGTPVRLNGVEYRFVTARGDDFALRLTERFRPAFRSRRPLFSSYAFNPSYHLHLALALRKEQPDAIRISNFSQLVPVLRRACPSAFIVLSMHCEWLNQLDPRVISRRLAGVDAVVGVSDYITDRIREALPEHAGRCRTIHNGANVESIAPPPDRRGTGGPVRILTVGRISPEKGTHVLLEAFARVAARRDDVELHVVGKEGIPDLDMLLNIELNPRVRALAPQFREGYLERIRSSLPDGARSRVHFHPWVEHAELGSYYAQADAFVFPSIWEEAFGLPVAEAMAAGLPVVASRVGGIPEIVDEGVTGLLVEPDDVSSLAEALDGIAESESRRLEMGAAGRRRAIERWSWDRAAEGYRTLFSPPERRTRGDQQLVGATA
jgi:glycosyltransferase involved in cell wall biosynthesis